MAADQGSRYDSGMQAWRRCVASFVFAGALTAQDTPAPPQPAPILTVEVADLSQPLGELGGTVPGRKLLAAIGELLPQWLHQAKGQPADKPAPWTWLGRTRAELRRRDNGLQIGVRAAVKPGAPATLADDVLAALRAGDDARGHVVCRRDGDKLRLGISLAVAAAPPEVAPFTAAAPIRVHLDLVQALIAAVVLPDAVSTKPAPLDPRAARIEAVIGDAMRDRLQFTFDLHAVDGRLAADVRNRSGTWLNASGRRLLQLLPVDFEGGFGVSGTDVAFLLPLLRGFHAVEPWPGVDAGDDPIAVWQKQTGVDLDQLVPAVEGSCSTFLAYDGTTFDPGMMNVFALRDPAPAVAAVDALLEHLVLRAKVTQREYSGYTVQHLSLGVLVLQWAFTEHELIVAVGERLARDLIEDVLDRARALADGKPLPLPGALGAGVVLAACDVGRVLGSAVGEENARTFAVLKDFGLGQVDARVLETAEGQVLRIVW